MAASQAGKAQNWGMLEGRSKELLTAAWIPLFNGTLIIHKPPTVQEKSGFSLPWVTFSINWRETVSLLKRSPSIGDPIRSLLFKKKMAEEQVTKTKLQKQVEDLMKAPFKVQGDYRHHTYTVLVNKAVTILYEDLFGAGKNPRHLSAYATCCSAWGEKRTLLIHHPKEKVLEAGPEKEVIIRTREDLAAMIIGKEPSSPDQVWMVEYPKTKVVCRLQEPPVKEAFFNRLLSTAVIWFDGDCSTLGKRLGDKKVTITRETQTPKMTLVPSKSKKSKNVAIQTERTMFPGHQKDETSKKISKIMKKLSTYQEKESLLRKLELIEEQMRDHSSSPMFSPSN